MCAISSRVWLAHIASLQLINSAPCSASAAYDITDLMVLDIVNTAPFFGGKSVFLDIKKFPPDLLLKLFQKVTRRRCGPLGPYHLRCVG